jgi:hypothetical protein
MACLAFRTLQAINAKPDERHPRAPGDTSSAIPQVGKQKMNRDHLLDVLSDRNSPHLSTYTNRSDMRIYRQCSTCRKLCRIFPNPTAATATSRNDATMKTLVTRPKITMRHTRSHQPPEPFSAREKHILRRCGENKLFKPFTRSTKYRNEPDGTRSRLRINRPLLTRLSRSAGDAEPECQWRAVA